MLQAVNVIWEELVSFLNCDQQNKNKPFASVIRYIWNDCFCYGSISFRFYPKQHKNGPNFLLIEDIWCILLLKLPLNILWWFLWTISRAGRSLSHTSHPEDCTPLLDRDVGGCSLTKETSFVTLSCIFSSHQQCRSITIARYHPAISSTLCPQYNDEPG